MTRKALAILLALLGFAVLTGYALYDVGISGIFGAATADSGALQVFVDLIIVCFLACMWMFIDGRKRSLNPWPYIVITVLAGAFGPLLYLLRREWRSEPVATSDE